MQVQDNRMSDGEDVARFDVLYAEWSDRLYRYIIHLVGPGPLADDLFQDSWMKAIERADQLRDSNRFGPWLLRIARNLAFNHSRKGRRRGRVWIFSNLPQADPDMDGESELLGRQADKSPTPRQQAIDRERGEILQSVISGLDVDTQEMLQLRYFEGLTLAEVSEVMEVPLGTVCTRVYRGLKTVRAHMQRQGFTSLGTL